MSRRRLARCARSDSPAARCCIQPSKSVDQNPGTDAAESPVAATSDEDGGAERLSVAHRRGLFDRREPRYFKPIRPYRPCLEVTYRPNCEVLPCPSDALRSTLSGLPSQAHARSAPVPDVDHQHCRGPHGLFLEVSRRETDDRADEREAVHDVRSMRSRETMHVSWSRRSGFACARRSSRRSVARAWSGATPAIASAFTARSQRRFSAGESHQIEPHATEPPCEHAIVLQRSSISAKTQPRQRHATARAMQCNTPAFMRSMSCSVIATADVVVTGTNRGPGLTCFPGNWAISAATQSVLG